MDETIKGSGYKPSKDEAYLHMLGVKAEVQMSRLDLNRSIAMEYADHLIMTESTSLDRDQMQWIIDDQYYTEASNIFSTVWKAIKEILDKIHKALFGPGKPATVMEKHKDSNESLKTDIDYNKVIPEINKLIAHAEAVAGPDKNDIEKIKKHTEDVGIIKKTLSAIFDKTVKSHPYATGTVLTAGIGFTMYKGIDKLRDILEKIVVDPGRAAYTKRVTSTTPSDSADESAEKLDKATAEFVRMSTSVTTILKASTDPDAIKFANMLESGIKNLQSSNKPAVGNNKEKRQSTDNQASSSDNGGNGAEPENNGGDTLNKSQLKERLRNFLLKSYGGYRFTAAQFDGKADDIVGVDVKLVFDHSLAEKVGKFTDNKVDALTLDQLCKLAGFDDGSKSIGLLPDKWKELQGKLIKDIKSYQKSGNPNEYWADEFPIGSELEGMDMYHISRERWNKIYTKYIDKAKDAWETENRGKADSEKKTFDPNLRKNSKDNPQVIIRRALGIDKNGQDPIK